jgi:hypothetical protein
METPYHNLKDGKMVVTTAGTRQQLSSTPLPCGKVFITAREDNTDDIVVGGNTVVAALGATRSGNVLTPGNSMTVEINDLNKIWLDAVVSGEGVTYSYLF